MMRQPGIVKCPSLAPEDNTHVMAASQVPAIGWTYPTLNCVSQGYKANNDSDNNYHLLKVPSVPMLHIYNFT